MGARGIPSVVAAVVVCLGLCVSLRAAPTATLDLTTAGSWGLIGDARFEQYTGSHGAGTGHTEVFLVLQDKNHDGVEEAYNTDGSPLPLDAKERRHTNALLLSDVPVVYRDSVAYREFILDIAEKSSSHGRYLSLDQLMISLHTDGRLTGSASSVFSDAVYSLNPLGGPDDNWIKLNSRLSSGGGQVDMLALIPDSLFNNPAGQYVYLYSKLGERICADGCEEEWSTRPGDHDGCHPKVPAPAAVLLAAFGAGLASSLRRRVFGS